MRHKGPPAFQLAARCNCRLYRTLVYMRASASSIDGMHPILFATRFCKTSMCMRGVCVQVWLQSPSSRQPGMLAGGRPSFASCCFDLPGPAPFLRNGALAAAASSGICGRANMNMAKSIQPQTMAAFLGQVLDARPSKELGGDESRVWRLRTIYLSYTGAKKA